MVLVEKKKERTKEEKKKSKKDKNYFCWDKRREKGGIFWNLKEEWATKKEKKSTSMFGLFKVKCFGFIPKWPKQLHLQLVHWWVLGHSNHY